MLEAFVAHREVLRLLANAFAFGEGDVGEAGGVGEVVLNLRWWRQLVGLQLAGFWGGQFLQLMDLQRWLDLRFVDLRWWLAG